jgi:hypothetical protein
LAAKSACDSLPGNFDLMLDASKDRLLLMDAGRS